MTVPSGGIGVMFYVAEATATWTYPNGTLERLYAAHTFAGASWKARFVTFTASQTPTVRSSDFTTDALMAAECAP